MLSKIKRFDGSRKWAAVAAAATASMLSIGAHSAALGAVSLSDQASNAAYIGGSWATNANGGTGFAPWQLTPDISNSGVNQGATWGFDTESAANIFATTASPNINTVGVAWTLWSQNATGLDPVPQAAYRKFDYNLVPGASFSVNMATDAIGTQGAEGFQLQNFNPSTGYATPIIEVAAFASGTNYSVSWGGYSSSSQGFTNSQTSTISAIHDGTATGNNGNGLTVTVSITGAATASLTLTPLDTSLASDTLSSLSLNSLPINQIEFFNDNLGSGYQAAYFNSLSGTDPVVAPEPAALWLLSTLSGGTLLLIRRRRPCLKPMAFHNAGLRGGDIR